jgi:hypothetical protein
LSRNGSARPQIPRRRPRRPGRARPEWLEKQVLLSTVDWTNPAGGDWDVPANRSPGKVPGASDDVMIELPGLTVTHSGAAAGSIHSLTSQDALTIFGGSRSVANTSVIQNDLRLQEGIQTGTGTITVTGMPTRSGGDDEWHGHDHGLGWPGPQQWHARHRRPHPAQPRHRPHPASLPQLCRSPRRPLHGFSGGWKRIPVYDPGRLGRSGVEEDAAPKHQSVSQELGALRAFS